MAVDIVQAHRPAQCLTWLTCLLDDIAIRTKDNISHIAGKYVII
jgi:hypothetical protein